MVQGQVFLKGGVEGGGGLTLFLFKFFKVGGGGASWVKGWVLYKGGLEPPYELCSTN